MNIVLFILKNPVESKITPLIDSKLDFSKLGLDLRRVFTSDPAKIRAVCSDQSIPILKPSFL